MTSGFAFRPALACLIGLAIVFSGTPVTDVGAAENESVVDETPINEFDRDHWAYRPITPPPFPAVSQPNWARSPIDLFILGRLDDAGVRPAPRADRATLIRRLCFDLTGLPPSPAQLNRYLSDRRPGAYSRLVDRLISSPEFGRRWAQFWLDLARFAETDGFEHDKFRPHAWKYRNWVIEAFNDDMAYDQFVRWQIAGDVLASADQKPSGEIATAFCLSGPDMPDINSQDERKHVLMNEITSTVGAVFLSLQVGCAQCHDHMYDAISQADFYRLRAFFDPAVRLQKNKSVTTLKPVADSKASSHLMVRGDWRRRGVELQPAFPRIANANEQSPADDDPGQRRAALARWLTDREQPLTARSIVNRIWQHHFGKGLSTTPSDFGVMGDEPTHPELLDYLAKRLTDQDWSMKALHREIVLSATYQTRSDRPGAADVSQQPHGPTEWDSLIDADPDNKLLGRFPRRRLEAEAIRDAMFAVSETLNLEETGPGVQPPLPPEMIKTLKSGQWKASSIEADRFRRSIFIFARRNLRYPFFATFDRPAANASCAVRRPSTTAVQSLLLFNSETTMLAARRLAERMSTRHSTDSRRCVEIYQRLFAKPPTASELTDCIDFLNDQRDLLRAEGFRPQEAERESLVDLCRALLNTNQFIYID